MNTSSELRTCGLLAVLSLSMLASCGEGADGPAFRRVPTPQRETAADRESQPGRRPEEATTRRLATLASEQFPLLRADIDGTIAQFLEEDITEIPMRGLDDMAAASALLDRRERIVARARAAVEGRLRAISERAVAIINGDGDGYGDVDGDGDGDGSERDAAGRDAAAEFARGMRRSLRPFFMVLDLEQEQIEAYRGALAVLTDPTKVEWRDGAGRYRTREAAEQHNQLDLRVQQLEQSKLEPMRLLQERLGRAAPSRSR